MKQICWMLSLALIPASTDGQTRIDLRGQARNVDFSAASSTKPLRVGTILPSTCVVGEMFFKADATPGSNVYGCTVTNNWSVLAGGGGGFPFMPGQENKALFTNGTAAIWDRAVKSAAPGPEGGIAVTCSDGADEASGDCTMEADQAYVATQGGDNLFAGHNDFSRSASLRIKFGEAALAAADCASAAQEGRLYLESGDPGSVAGQTWVCGKSGASSWEWQPVGHMKGTTQPATCAPGQLFFDTDAAPGLNWLGCISTDTWTPLGGGGTGGEAAAVASVFGRTGFVTPQAGDYRAAQVTHAVDDSAFYANPGWLTSLAWGKITGAPATYAPSAHKAAHAATGADALTPADIGAQPAGAYEAPLSFAAPLSRTGNTVSCPTCGAGGGGSPLSFKGDLHTYSTADERLPAGSDGQVLTADATRVTGLKWATPVAAASYALTFDGSTSALADGSTLAWTCGSGSASQCTTSWNVPANVRWVRVEAWGGGAGGSGSTAGSGVGASGAGGGYWNFQCQVTPGETVTVNVGNGGIGSSSYVSQGNGGSSSFGTCFTVTGGASAGDTGWGGMLSTAYRTGGWASGTSLVNAGWASPGAGGVMSALRTDVGGCGAYHNLSSGTAGVNGGSAIGGGGAGGQGGYNNATGGAGGASVLGGAGGAGGAWTAGGGLVACGNGVAPGGGGGSAGIETAGGSNHAGCNGARGEVRVYYVK